MSGCQKLITLSSGNKVPDFFIPHFRKKDPVKEIEQLYLFEGWRFRWPSKEGGWPLNRDLKPFKRCPENSLFWDAYNRFCAMGKKRKKQLLYRSDREAKL